MPQSTSTEQFVSIETIKDDCVILKDGSLRAVLMVSGVNFDLKSEEEQNMIMVAYQGLLNRLDFPVQFVVHSRKLNIDSYLGKLKIREDEEDNALLKIQIKEYIEFIKTLVSVTNVMSKRFYIVVSYAAGAEEAEKVLGKIVKFLPIPLKKSTGTPEQKEEMDFESKKLQLKHRVDAVISGLRPTGIKTIRLPTEDLLELYYNLYNPEKVEKKSLKIMEEVEQG
jgi:type IV secretory pathway VirB4 component